MAPRKCGAREECTYLVVKITSDCRATPIRAFYSRQEVMDLHIDTLNKVAGEFGEKETEFRIWRINLGEIEVFDLRLFVETNLAAKQG